MDISDIVCYVIIAVVTQFLVFGMLVALGLLGAAIYFSRRDLFTPKKIEESDDCEIPRNLVVRQFSEDSICLTWDHTLHRKASGATIYSTEMKETETSRWIPIEGTSATESTAKCLSSEKLYHFRVSCVGSRHFLESAPIRLAKVRDSPEQVEVFRRGRFIVFDWLRPLEWDAKSYDIEMSKSGKDLWNPLASNVVHTKFIFDTDVVGFEDDTAYSYRITANSAYAKGIPKVVSCMFIELEDRSHPTFDPSIGLQSTDSVSQVGSYKLEDSGCPYPKHIGDIQHLQTSGGFSVGVHSQPPDHSDANLNLSPPTPATLACVRPSTSATLPPSVYVSDVHRSVRTEHCIASTIVTSSGPTDVMSVLSESDSYHSCLSSASGFIIRTDRDRTSVKMECNHGDTTNVVRCGDSVQGDAIEDVASLRSSSPVTEGIVQEPSALEKSRGTVLLKVDLLPNGTKSVLLTEVVPAKMT